MNLIPRNSLSRNALNFSRFILLALAIVIVGSNICLSVRAQTSEARSGAATGATKKSALDWSFMKDKRTWAGIGFATAGMIADQRSSRLAESRGAMESSPFLRRSDGRLSTGKHTLIGISLNAVMLPADLHPNHRYRWFALGGRIAIGAWWFSRAAHNSRL